MVKPKAKGSKFENEILKQCREIYPDTHKTLGSGSTDKDQGDLIFMQYCIECKHHKDFTDAILEGFWTKIQKEAEQRGKIPLLLYKTNRRKPIVMFKMKPGVRAMMYWDEFLEQVVKK